MSEKETGSVAVDAAVMRGMRRGMTRKGWSQKRLAAKAGISLSSIERMERGEPVELDTVLAVASALKTTVDRLKDHNDRSPLQLGVLNSTESEEDAAELEEAFLQ